MATELFSIRGRDYLVLVDTYSTFIEVDYMKSTSSEDVIHKLKSHFARHGAPDIVISDNGPQYFSAVFEQFSRDWAFEHQTSSPGDSQSNGAAEAAVKSVKTMMKKCLHNNEDMYIGLLNLRNTPTEGLKTSPAQRLMGRRTKSLVPTSTEALKPSVPHDEKPLLEAKKMTAAERYTHRRTLAPLQAGESVRIQPIRGEREWQKATVEEHLDGKSYKLITEEGRSLRRGRKHLRKDNSNHDMLTALAPNAIDDNVRNAPMAPSSTSNAPMAPSSTSTEVTSDEPKSALLPTCSSPPRPVNPVKIIPNTTRSGRVVVPPARFKD
jgi:hypothetical protein